MKLKLLKDSSPINHIIRATVFMGMILSSNTSYATECGTTGKTTLCVDDVVYMKDTDWEYKSVFKGIVTHISQNDGSDSDYKYDYTIQWDTGEEMTTQYIRKIAKEEEYTKCIPETNACAGDRVLINSVGDLVYAEILGSFTSLEYNKVRARVVGAGREWILDDKIVPFKGSVEGFPQFQYGQEVESLYSSKDIILAYDKLKYYVYLGDKGDAVSLSERSLRKRLGLSESSESDQSSKNEPIKDDTAVPSNEKSVRERLGLSKPSLPAQKIKSINISGNYELMSCDREVEPKEEDNEHTYKLRFHGEKGDEIVIKQDDKNIQLSFGYYGSSKFSYALVDYNLSNYDLSKARFTKNSIIVRESNTDAHYWPVPWGGKGSLTESFKLEGDILTIKAKFSEKYITLLGVFGHSGFHQCKLRKL